MYTYHPQCVHCAQHTNNWDNYLAFSLLPQTVFFVVFLALRFRGLSPHVNGFILYSQLITPPPVLRVVATLVYNYRKDTFFSDRNGIRLIHAVLTFHSVWNMDFLRLTYEPFCLHSKASALQILALDYVIAVYPLLLIVFIYLRILVKLYYQNWSILTLLWKPFQRCSTWCNTQWNITTSLVHAFATILLLSYIKLLSVSFTLLFPAVILDTNNGFYTPTYLGTTHIPYFLLAVVCLSTFTLLPMLLLCLYPCLWFQNCLNHCSLSFPALHIFMDAFQGSYKNGMNGTKDYRYFAGGNLLLMVAVYFSLICQIIFMKYLSTVLVVAVFLGAFSTCQQDCHNNLHITWLLLVLFFYSVAMPFLLQHEQADTFIGSVLCLGFVFIPPLCIAYVGIRLILSCFKWWKHYCLKAVNKWKWCWRQEQGLGDGADESHETPLLNEDRVMYSSIEIPMNA